MIMDNTKYIYRGILECPLYSQHLVCRYTGTCVTCPIKLLLNTVNALFDARTDTHLASTLRVLIRDYYKI